MAGVAFEDLSFMRFGGLLEGSLFGIHLVSFPQLEWTFLSGEDEG